MNNAEDYIKEHNIKSYNDIQYMTVSSPMRIEIWKILGEFCYVHDYLWGKEYVSCPAGHTDSRLCSRQIVSPTKEELQKNSDLVKARMTKEEQDEATEDMLRSRFDVGSGVEI